MNKKEGMTQTQLGMILIVALLAAAVACAVVSGFMVLSELRPWAGHVA